jgi:hypothetical protein
MKHPDGIGFTPQTLRRCTPPDAPQLLELRHDGLVNVTLLYFDGCPNWTVADERLREALDKTGNADVEVSYRKVSTPQDAESVQFRGSPTILVDGLDPFLEGPSPVGLSCRVYRSETGFAGAPTLEQLIRVLG